MNVDYTKMPTRQEAEKLLDYAGKQNPGNWIKHSEMVAQVAEKIALNCGLNSEKAYICGLLHDIGRYEGVRELHHVIAGYTLLMENGYGDVAGVCLTHSFPIPNLNMFGGGGLDCTDEEIDFIKNYINNNPYDDYDNLIQLSDALGTGQGITTIDSRLMDVTRRHGFNEYTIEKWNSFFNLKEKFDSLCKENIYKYFIDDIVKTIIFA